jgi:asparagine synthase (glutamine-hydrolysing)
MLWFGGFSGPHRASRVPVGARPIWSAVVDCWLLGEWPAHEARAAHTAHRSVAVIGPCGMPVSELARLATHGVPDDVAWRWSGSYVVVQMTDHATTVWTDLGGAWPLYTLAADGGIYWASSSRALAGLTQHRLDQRRLAASLLAPAVPALVGGRSAFADISLVPAGHRMHLPATRRVEIRRVWRPRSSAADHAEQLRHELATAVAVRVDAASTPTVDLSGGYDSTTLALLAAEHMHPERTVIGVTVHPEGVTDGGDLTYARHTASHHPGIAHRLMPLTATDVPYSGLDALPVTDEPAPSTIAHARFSAQLRWMRNEFGSDCHLTGDGGDALLTTPPIMLAELIARRRYRRALSETFAWARLRRVAIWPLLMDAIRVAYTSDTVLHEWARSLEDGMPTPTARRQASGVEWGSTVSPPPWATRRARELTAELAADVADQHTPGRERTATAEVIAEMMATVGRTARADAQLAEAHKIALHNPFIDSRVINSYLAVPLDARPGPAQFKPILRNAMHDLFPPMLSARTTKGTFTSDYYGGVRANLATLLTMAVGHLADAGLVDPASLRQTLTQVAAGVPISFATVQPVIATEAWLHTLETSEPVAWEPTTNRQHAHRESGAA